MHKSKYLTELLGRDYIDLILGNRKVILTGPTGLGKTYFVINCWLGYIANSPMLIGSRKLLILCNRKLLRDQYWYSLIDRYDRYSSLKDTVEVMTYQELARRIKNCTDVCHIFKEYVSIICDEAHYFYADSDFNGFGTSVVLNAIMRSCMNKSVLFISATITETLPLIRNTFDYHVKKWESDGSKINYPENELVVRNYSEYADYSHINCIVLEDMESLAIEISRASGKSLIFIDSKSRAAKLAKDIKSHKNINDSDVVVMNSDNIDTEELRDVVESLFMINKLKPNVLITTSVLDNGVSICDESVKNVAIITESRISFLQMIGRIRKCSNNLKINLFLVIRDAEFFRSRGDRYRALRQAFDDAENNRHDPSDIEIVDECWSNPDSDASRQYRTIFIPAHREISYIPESMKRNIQFQNGVGLVYKTTTCTGLLFNEFGREKVGDMAILEDRFFKLALEDPRLVIEEQCSWIGKKPQDITYRDSEYLAKIRNEFVDEALEIKKYDSGSYTKAKNDLYKKYHHELFRDIKSSNYTPETNKFKEILERFDLILVVEDDKNARKRIYSVVRKDSD